MIGFIDIGGGMRGIYTSGIYDGLIDRGISPEYCIGVSSGSGNLITYVSGQKGRTFRFYHDYAFEKEYMGVGNVLKKGSFINLDYIYSGITNSTGKDPLDFEAFMKSDCRFTAVSTVAQTGKPHYFTKDDFKKDDYSALKAACALPVACRPVKINGVKYYDGGVSDTVPYKKAFADGCDKVILCITKPVEFTKSKLPAAAVRSLLCKYPESAKQILTMHERYNDGIKALVELEKQGKALVVAPKECFGIETLKKNKDGMKKLYQLGCEDAARIENFINNAKRESAR